ncbi:glyceraldehyde-3-phosphate dehydrogenase [uncultured Shimia sp.]|nr:glyceraldehyde-3-phosphate dehydrogenase [uncultured Shimia sp.]
MTNPIAVFLAVVILAGLGFDLIWLNGQATLMLARKFFELVEWLAFWR